MPQIDKLLKLGVSQRASDLHLSSGEPLRFRVDGELVEASPSKLSAKQVSDILMEMLNETERQRLDTHKNLDKSHSVEGAGNFRVNIFYTRRGLASVMRSIPSKIPTFQDLGLPDSLEKLAEIGKGMVLVTGPTGSGKSTTLAALIDYINTRYNYHVLTVEDPIEFVHSSKRSLINQREIGSHCQTFSDALKYALREDPDVILVGEMRDLETISLALTAAETGHLVLGTLHTRGAAASVDRIIDSFPAGQQAMIRAMLSESLAAVVSQSLLKRADGAGRVAAYEILISNHAISNLIREGKTYQINSAIQTGRKDGMVLMDQHITDLVQKGIVDPEEAVGYMEDPGLIKNFRSARPTKVEEPMRKSPPPMIDPNLDILGEATEEVTPPPMNNQELTLETPPAMPAEPPKAPPQLPTRAAAPASAPKSSLSRIPVGGNPAAAPKKAPAPAPEPAPVRNEDDEVTLAVEKPRPAPSLKTAPKKVPAMERMSDPAAGDGPTMANVDLKKMALEAEEFSHDDDELSIATDDELLEPDLSKKPASEEAFETPLTEREDTATFEIPSLTAPPPPPPPTPKSKTSAPPPKAPPSPAAAAAHGSSKLPPPPPPLPRKKAG